MLDSFFDFNTIFRNLSLHLISVLNALHDAAVAYIECPNCTTSSFKRKILLYDRIDKEILKQKLDQADWNALLGSLNDVDEMCNTFTETFVRIAIIYNIF
jgi:hypothetical protein